MHGVWSLLVGFRAAMVEKLMAREKMLTVEKLKRKTETPSMCPGNLRASR